MKTMALRTTLAAAGLVLAALPALDEDGDGAMDRFLGMIPTEGYGLSKDPEVSGPPQFDACAFRLDGVATADLVVPLHY